MDGSGDSAEWKWIWECGGGGAQKPWDGSSQVCRGFGVLFSVCTQHSIVQRGGELLNSICWGLGIGGQGPCDAGQGSLWEWGSLRAHSPPPVGCLGGSVESCHPAGALEDDMPAWPPSQDREGTLSIPVLEPWPWVDLG